MPSLSGVSLVFLLAVVLPPGWSGRTDDGSIDQVKVVVEGAGIRITTGPATILYRQADSARGPFHTLATFTQTRPSGHEAYGLFVGGRDLTSARQQYVYFLVRGDGSYIVKRRDGTGTVNLTAGWVSSPAVKRPDGAGRATNKLEIDGKINAGRLAFKVNGTEVYAVDAKTINLDGIVGLRINHNLDLQVTGFDLHRM